MAYEKSTKINVDICDYFHLKDLGGCAIIALAVCLHFILSLFMNLAESYHEIFTLDREDGV